MVFCHLSCIFHDFTHKATCFDESCIMTNHHLNGVWFLPNTIFGFEQKHDQTTFCFVLMNSTGNNISNYTKTYEYTISFTLE